MGGGGGEAVAAASAPAVVTQAGNDCSLLLWLLLLLLIITRDSLVCFCGVQAHVPPAWLSSHKETDHNANRYAYMYEALLQY
jgi:hypothetical protein